MKKHAIYLLASSCLLTIGCRSNNQYSEVVKETYIHKYGVPVAKDAWVQQGKDGKVIQLRKDGVTVSKCVENGVLCGETTYTYPNSSTVHRVEMYRDGKLISARDHYPSGVPKKEEIYEGEELVTLTRWYEDGTPSANETYKNTFLITGVYRTPLNVIESRIQDGHGTRIYRSSDGDLLSKDTVQNGQMVEKITYYSNGDPSTVTPYKDGVVHGMRLTFLQGGLPNTVEQWVYGQQDGVTVIYQNGEKVAEVPYVRGKKNGTEYRYRDGTLLVEEVNWKENIQHGQRKIYVDGDTKTEWYHQGEMVSRTTFERMNLPR